MRHQSVPPQKRRNKKNNVDRRGGSQRVLTSQLYETMRYFSSLNSKNIKASQEVPYMEMISLVSQPGRVSVTFNFV